MNLNECASFFNVQVDLKSCEGAGLHELRDGRSNSDLRTTERGLFAVSVEAP